MDKYLFTVICDGRREEAEEAIQKADLDTLLATQKTNLVGDWRRAGVAKRIKQLEKLCLKPS